MLLLVEFDKVVNQAIIEVTFKIDRNGLINVSAHDKSTGKSESLTVTGESRISKEEIDRMVSEAEIFAADDELLKGKITARYELENYLNGIKNDVADSREWAGKLSEDDEKELLDVIKEKSDWLDANLDASKDDMEEQKAELDAIVEPIKLRWKEESGGEDGHDEL